MSLSLPENPSLEHLRKQAKQLLASFRKGDANALRRLNSLPSRPAKVALHDAQSVIAREHGFPSWPKLVADVERIVATKGITDDVVAAFVDAATSDHSERCRRFLSLYPNFPRFNAVTALICGDVEAVRRSIGADAGFAATQLGSKNWTPLEYCTYSRMFGLSSEAYAGLEECARLLLDAGANPNSSHCWDKSSPPLSALYGAAGETGHAGIVKLLLERGANPNDEESMYHAAQHNRSEILSLLVAHGGDVDAKGSAWTNTPIFFLAGWRPTDPGYDAVVEGIEWLLNHGADPNIVCYPKKAAETALHCACRTNGTKVVEFLLAHGADPSIRRADGKTAYELALLTGNRHAANVLLKAGEQIRVAQADAPFIAVISGEPYDANLVKEWATEHEVEAVTALTKLAEFGKVAEVRALLNVGVPVSGTAEAGATPLHYACFTGQTEVVKLLIQHGASLTIRDDTYKATPLGWALEAFGWHRRMDVDYRELVCILLRAGASQEHVQRFVDDHCEDHPDIEQTLSPLLA